MDIKKLIIAFIISVAVFIGIAGIIATFPIFALILCYVSVFITFLIFTYVLIRDK